MNVREKIIETTAAKMQGSSLTRRHFVDGVTKYMDEKLNVVNIEVTMVPKKTKPVIVELARRHENGHADVARDIMSNVPDHIVPVLKGYDTWTGEVEAWMRGLERAVIDWTDATFILDCMNTYRRGRNVPDELWSEFVELLITKYSDTDHSADDVREYEPLEPDPNDAPPTGCGFDPDGEPFGTPIPGPDEEDGDDAEGGDEGDGEGGSDDEKDADKNGNKKDGKPNKGGGDEELNMDDAKFDNGWLKQEVLDAVADGADFAATAKKYGLDPNRLPPLLEAMRK